MALDAMRGAGVCAPREVLLLGIEHDVVEVYDMRLYDDGPPEQLVLASLGGTILAATLASSASLAVAAFVDDEGVLLLRCYEVEGARCNATLRPDVSRGERVALAHNERDNIFALAAAGGTLVIYSTNALGPPIVWTDAAAALRIHDGFTSGGFGEAEDDAAGGPWPTVTFCGEEPLLAMTLQDWVVVYRYNARVTTLEHTALLRFDGLASLMPSLAWAPGLGAVLLAAGAEWCIWLPDATQPETSGCAAHGGEPQQPTR
eukprot:NODE_13357_length_1170_cov_6.162991.p1 GENE.NODE_13357_length_1170_cov_6.162991~~NODE_13357_length_1170_cov_6.162991.p1  ORF type:complete len:301 (-),score=89.56 NODE_13357_length_1170_cov_6.162991:268-1047(-)